MEHRDIGSCLCWSSEDSTVEFSIAAKFLTKRALSVEVLARTFTPLWRVRNGFKIQNIGNHRILFTFDNKDDVDRILLSEPWSFDKHLGVMQWYDSDMSIQDLKFEKTTFWVQIHGIQLRYTTLEVAIKIYEVVGDVLWPVVSIVSDGGNFLQVQVLVDISLPLCRGRLISLNNKKHV